MIINLAMPGSVVAEQEISVKRYFTNPERNLHWSASLMLWVVRNTNKNLSNQCQTRGYRVILTWFFGISQPKFIVCRELRRGTRFSLVIESWDGISNVVSAQLWVNMLSFCLTYRKNERTCMMWSGHPLLCFLRYGESERREQAIPGQVLGLSSI